MLDLEIRDARDARYASHVPVVNAWLAGHKWDIIEFGCGRFSTPLLIQYARSLICYEKNSAWRQEVSEAVPDVDIRPVPPESDDFKFEFARVITPEHVVFVDGSPGQWRVDAIRCAQQKLAQLIIAHDWSDKQVGYGYHLLGDNNKYTKYVYKCETTKLRTAVFRYTPIPENHLLQK